MAVPDGQTSAAPTLLVCDDSQLQRSALAQFLREAGYCVEEAADGQAAITHLKHRSVDLLLLDLNMPTLSGFDVIEYLREHRPSLRIVLLSGMAPERIQDGMGAMRQMELPPLLIKPVDPEQLLQVVELQLSGELPSPGTAPAST